MQNRREKERDSYKYFLTTCGLICFTVFFSGTFFSFIFAGETDHYEYTIVLAFGMLFVTSVSFCCVLHESRRVHSIELQPAEFSDAREPEVSNEPQSDQELLLQSQSDQELLLQSQSDQELLPQSQSDQEFLLQSQLEPKLSGQPKTEPHLEVQPKFKIESVRAFFEVSPRESVETTSSENNSDSEMLALRKMAKTGLHAGGEKSMAGTSKESQDEDTTNFEGAVDFQLDSTKAGSSKVAGKSSEVTESRSDDVPLKDMSALSLSDSSKNTPDSEEKQAEVSAALSQMSLDSSEEQATKISTKNHSSTDSEEKPEAEEGELSKLESQKEA